MGTSVSQACALYYLTNNLRGGIAVPIYQIPLWFPSSYCDIRPLIGIASLRTCGTSIGSHTFLRWILSWIPCVERCCFDLCVSVVCNEEATKLTDHNHGEGPSIDYHGSSAVKHVRRWEGLGWRMCL